MLGHYKFSSTTKEREELDRTTKQYYETTMTEWLAVEAIVRQKDKEIMAANIAKLSSESTSGEPVPLTPGLANDISNDVSFYLLKFLIQVIYCWKFHYSSYYFIQLIFSL